MGFFKISRDLFGIFIYIFWDFLRFFSQMRTGFFSELFIPHSQEGDMHVTKLEQLAEKGKVQLDEVLEDLDKWPTTTIPYVFARNFSKGSSISYEWTGM